MSDWRSRCRPSATRHHHYPRQGNKESRQADFGNGLLSSDSLIVAHLGLPFVVEFGDRLLDGDFEVLDGLECAVSEEVALEIAPGAFDVVQFGRVFRQPLNGQPGPHRERGAGQLADVDRAVVEHQHDGEHLASRLGSVAEVQLLQQSDEIAAALVRADMHDQFAGPVVEHAEQRPLARLTRCRDAQVGTPLGPGMRQIRMGQHLGFIAEQENDVAGFGLLAQQTQPQPRPVDGLGILPPAQAMAGTPPTEPPFLSALLSCDLEMVTPLRAASSVCNRGSVQFGRSVTGADRTSRAKASAASLLTGAAPVCGLARNPSTPSAMNHVRQRRTLSGVTPNARAICPLVQPPADNRMARARSASSRRAESANASNSEVSSVVVTTRGRPTMIASPSVTPIRAPTKCTVTKGILLSGHER